MDTPASATSPPADGVTQDLRDLIEEFDRLLRSAVSAGDRQLDAARVELGHRLRRLRLQLDDLQAQAAHRARRAVRAADLAVQEHPYRAMGIGAVTGVLV